MQLMSQESKENVKCLLVHWNIGPLVHWSIDRMVHWSIGPSVRWSIGPLVECWMFNVIKVKLLSERTSGVPPVIFAIARTITCHASSLPPYFLLWMIKTEQYTGWILRETVRPKPKKFETITLCSDKLSITIQENKITFLIWSCEPTWRFLMKHN